MTNGGIIGPKNNLSGTTASGVWGLAEHFDLNKNLLWPNVPRNTSIPFISGIPTEIETLTALPGTWSNSPTSYSYQWRRGNSNISGATLSTYKLVAADIGQAISVAVTATNSIGNSTAAISLETSNVLQFATGGSTSISGGYRIHTFTSTGTFTTNSSGNIEYLIVAGGAGGGKSVDATRSGGGGGAGGLISGSTSLSAGNYQISVGLGGAGNLQVGNIGSDSTTAHNGQNSSAFNLTAIGGGSGGGGGGSAGGAGGSGGGSGRNNSTIAAGTSGQGNDGGPGATGGTSGIYGGGGGGGMGGPGTEGTTSVGGNGGSGISSSITGTAQFYAAGGGGARSSGSPGTGGSGIGGAGASGESGTGGNGLDGTGSGGGGGSTNASGQTGNGGSGGSGIVIIRYTV